MNYYVIVLPMSTEGTVNRQMYAYSDLDSAKQGFHTQCGKYFMNPSCKMASVCIIDDYCNMVMSDNWVSYVEPEPETEPIEEM